eukprot:scaffold1169_cov367-Prasinococcus_capsulatus_cf.AAC.21
MSSRASQEGAGYIGSPSWLLLCERSAAPCGCLPPCWNGRSRARAIGVYALGKGEQHVVVVEVVVVVVGLVRLGGKGLRATLCTLGGPMRSAPRDSRRAALPSRMRALVLMLGVLLLLQVRPHPAPHRCVAISARVALQGVPWLHGRLLDRR